MDTKKQVKCPFECMGLGYYPTADEFGEDTQWVECPMHHSSFN